MTKYLIETSDGACIVIAAESKGHARQIAEIRYVESPIIRISDYTGNERAINDKTGFNPIHLL